MLKWVIDANKSASINKCIIVIPEESKAFKGISNGFDTVVQKIPKGTGDAVKKASVLLLINTERLFLYKFQKQQSFFVKCQQDVFIKKELSSGRFSFVDYVEKL